MNSKLGENIKSMRKSRSLTQEQLAEAMGVSAGAVYKWESQLSYPDIETVMSLADFFEVSTDVLLGYEMRSGRLSEILDRMEKYQQENDFDKAIAESKKALQKYPNNFMAVYKSAVLHYVTVSPEHARTAIELFSRSLELIDQNTSEHIDEFTIRNHIAGACLILCEHDKAVEMYKKNNPNGLNAARIGNILANFCQRYDEALPYLTESLLNITTELLYMTSGFISVYIKKKKYQKAIALLLWLIDIYEGLTDEGKVSYLTKSVAICYSGCAVCAELDERRDDASDFLRKAKKIALLFNSDPVYSMKNLKFYDGIDSAYAYDEWDKDAVIAVSDMLTALGEKTGIDLNDLWEEICNEEN